MENIVLGTADRILKFESVDKKMVNLKRKMDYLESREEDVRTELDYADSSSMRKQRKTVEHWLTNVGGMKNRVQQLEQEVRERRLYNYVQLQNTVDKVTEEVKELIQLGSFPEGLTLVAHDNQGLPLPTPELVGQKFEEQKKMIKECIWNDNIHCIGIYGMGGVGKTTLVKHVHNELLNHSNSSVFWVVASQNFSILKLQSDIAKEVHAGLLNEDDESKRAAILAKALKRRRNSVLIIDDLWNDFPPESVGIVGGGCKLVFTTRSLKVCQEMKSHKLIKVETLSDEEARELFMKTLGTGTTLTPQIEEIAKSLIKECDGLPLGIITVAGSMRGEDDICEWNNALETLRQATAGQDDHLQFGTRVFRVLKYSYDMLKNPTLQECFLYCSLYPEDAEIDRDELIAYFIDEGLISGMRNREAEFNRGHTILNKLVKVCLLQGEISGSCVKMHDLVRDMALQIASEGSRFLVLTRDKSMNEEKWSVDLERVSFFYSHIDNSASQPMCPRLSTLLLGGCGFTNGIPNSFFTHMDKLTVLDLSDTNIVTLPVSISNLKSLSALLLRRCKSLEKLCPLSDLRVLKRLDLTGAGIKELPEGMDLLTNLRELNLSHTSNLQMIPEGILPKLSHLQHLKLPTASGVAKVRGEEIARLRKLEIFEGKFYNINDLHMYINSWEESRPNKYILCVGKKDYHYLPSLQSVHISECPDLVMLCQLDLLKKASDLRTCFIKNCRGMTHFFCTVCYNRLFVERLKTVRLHGLKNLRELLSEERCSSSVAASAAVPALSTGAFSSLTKFTITHCHKIKKLFTPTLLSHLQNLESIDIYSCDQLEEIVQVPDEDQDQEATDSTSLPKVNNLWLSNLPELKSFCSTRKLVSDSLKEISIMRCPKLKRLPLFREDSHSPTSLQRITVNEQLWESIEFQLPNTKDILTPIVHFDNLEYRS